MDKEEKKQNKTIFFSPPTRKIKFSVIRKHILARLRANEFKELVGDLTAYQLGKEQLKAFFMQEGYIILDWAITKGPDTEALKFLIKFLSEHIGKEILQNILLPPEREHNVLDLFLTTEAGRQMLNRYDDKAEKVQIEKFAILLSVDRSGICKFMEANATARYMTDKTKEVFTKALASIEKQSYPSKAL